MIKRAQQLVSLIGNAPPIFPFVVSETSAACFPSVLFNEKISVSAFQALQALNESVSSAKNSSLLPSYIKFNYITKNDNCNSEVSLMGMMDAYTLYCPHVLIGPVCDYALGKVSNEKPYSYKRTIMQNNKAKNYTVIIYLC